MALESDDPAPPRAETRYDAVAYPARAYVQTHPIRLATIANLFGLTPAPIERCRVLELGCGDGANLIPMAIALPDSTFVGIDAAARAIEAGRDLTRELGLSNVALSAGDLKSLDPELGVFDYIISHGVYSWIPSDARDALIAACKSHLAPNGIAYVSYAVYPGCHSRNLVRDMMLFHAGDVADPPERVARGIDFVRFVRAQQGPSSAYAALLDEELKRLSNDPGYVFHDDFSETNEPIYFAEFTAHAGEHGLKFVAEAGVFSLGDPFLESVGGEQVRKLAAGDVVAEQQYLDFVRGAAFRQSLLCHAELTPRTAPDPERLRALYASSPLQPAATSDDDELRAETPATFETTDGGTVRTSHPLMKAALRLLAAAWPDALPVARLFEQACAAVGNESKQVAPRAEAIAALGSALLHAAAMQVIELSVSPPRHAIHAGEKPVASPLCRLQLSSGDVITTLRHLAIRIEDPATKHLIGLLDGTRTRAELLEAISGRFALPSTTGPERAETNDHDARIDPSAKELDAVLERLASRGVLIS